MARRYKSAISGGQIYRDAIIDTDLELIEVNRDNLLSGFNALGVKITRAYRSAKYAEKKRAKNALPGYGVPDLNLTGSFYNAIEFHISGANLVWENSDSKAAKLLEKYGSVLGVSENERLQRYRTEYLYPAIARGIKAKTGMK